MLRSFYTAYLSEEVATSKKNSSSPCLRKTNTNKQLLRRSSPLVRSWLRSKDRLCNGQVYPPLSLYQSCRYMLWSMRGNMWKAPPLYVNKSCVFKCGASFNYNEETRVIEECIDKNIWPRRCSSKKRIFYYKSLNNSFLGL